MFECVGWCLSVLVGVGVCWLVFECVDKVIHESHTRTTLRTIRLFHIDLAKVVVTRSEEQESIKENQTSLGRVLVSNVVTRISYINYEI